MEISSRTRLFAGYNDRLLAYAKQPLMTAIEIARWHAGVRTGEGDSAMRTSSGASHCAMPGGCRMRWQCGKANARCYE